MFWFLVVSIVPLAVVGIQGYVLARRAIIQEVFLHMEAVAGHKRTLVEEWLRERAADLNVLASNPLIKNVFDLPQSRTNERAVAGEMESSLRNLPEFDELLLVNQEDTLFFSTNDADSAPQVRMDGLFLGEWQILGGDLSGIRISGVRYGRALGTWLYMGREVDDDKKQRLGWIAARLLLSRSLDRILMDSTGLGQSGHAYLVNHDKVMLTRSRHLHHPDPGTHKMSSAAIDSALSGSSGVGIYKGWQGQPSLGAWQYLPMTGWALIAEMNQSEALAGLESLKRNWLVVFLATLATILVIVAVLARSISRPILSLTRAAERVSKGDLSARADIRSHDEIGVLANTFNDMGEALIDSQLSLKESYQKLIQAERKLIQSEKLAAIGEVVASVVHELRNPLSAVKMNLKILARKQEPDSPLWKNIEIAQDQVLKLEHMLSDILDYAKPVELHRASHDASRLLGEAVELLQERIDKYHVEVIWRLQPDLPALKCDRELILQALINLIQNSIEAVANRDLRQLTLTTLSLASDDAEVVIELSDTGVGLSPSQLKRVFEPFYTTRRDGTGLGLPNAKKIIELHRGRLDISSRQDEETTVRISLPRGGNDV